MNNPFLKDIFAQLDIVSEQVKQNFIDLDESQLNWKPNEKSWSIGQCLDHLIVTNNQYSKIFKDFSSGQKKVNIFERMGLLSGVWASFLKKATLPNPTQKTKTFEVFEPSKSEIPSDIARVFLNENERFKDLIRNLDKLNLEKTMMSSPVSNMIVYSLKDALIILANHEERHFNQAMNVMNQPAFPKNEIA